MAGVVRWFCSLNNSVPRVSTHGTELTLVAILSVIIAILSDRIGKDSTPLLPTVATQGHTAPSLTVFLQEKTAFEMLLIVTTESSIPGIRERAQAAPRRELFCH